MISEIFHEASIVIILGIIIWNFICKFLFSIIRQDNTLTHKQRVLSLIPILFLGGVGMGSAQKYVAHKKAPLNSADFKVAKWIGTSISITIIMGIIVRWGNMFVTFYTHTIAPNLGGFIVFCLFLGGAPLVLLILIFGAFTGKNY